MTQESWVAVDEVLNEALSAAVTPAAVLLVARDEEILLERAWGRMGLGEAARHDTATSTATVFDVASLTKPLVTVFSSLVLMARGRLSLEDRVADYLDAFAGASGSPGWDRRDIRVRDLLNHSSGLPDWRPYYLQIELGDRGASVCVADAQAREKVIKSATTEPLVYQPGTRSLYSDLGYILLGRIVELVGGQDLDAFARDTLFEPLGFEATGFVRSPQADRPAPPRPAGEVAPCGLCSWRGAVVRGQVQDENAWAMGGVAGHAGLFSTAREVHLLVLEHLRALRGKSAILAGEFVELAWRRSSNDPQRTWALGWDTPSARGSTGGGLISPDSVGHLGYTGCSLWVDRARGVHVILLTNRVHPHPKNRAIARLRPVLHDAVFAAIDAAAGRGEPYARGRGAEGV